MAEKWFQFVSRIKKETGAESLKEAMKIASKRKSEWNKDGAAPAGKTGKKMRKSRARRGTRKAKK
jgi:hypothetical protein